MNISTPVTTISPEDRTHTETRTDDVLNHSAPAARYGQKASLLTQITDCVVSLFSKPPKLTFLLLVVALTLPATIAIVSTGLNTAEKNLLENRHVTVFLTETSSSKATQLAATLAVNKHIRAAVPGLVDLQNKEVITIDIYPAHTVNKAQLNIIVRELSSHTSVEYVAADEAWLNRNITAIKTTKLLNGFSIAVAALLTAALVCLLTRSILPQQHKELSVLHQMGASRPMTLQPLLLLCIILTVLASTIGTLMAWGIIASMPYLVDMTTYSQILPDKVPAVRLISLLILAVVSSAMTVKLFVKYY